MAKEKSVAASSDMSRLCGLLEQKIAAFREFVSSTISLKDMIREHNMEAVEGMIARRGDHIALINKLDEQIRIIRNGSRFHDIPFNPDTEKHVNSLLKMLEGLIGKTLRLNQDCEVAAETELRKLGNDLSHLTRSDTSFKGYKGRPGEPRFMDVTT